MEMGVVMRKLFLSFSRTLSFSLALAFCFFVTPHLRRCWIQIEWGWRSVHVFALYVQPCGLFLAFISTGQVQLESGSYDGDGVVMRMPSPYLNLSLTLSLNPITHPSICLPKIHLQLSIRSIP